MSGLAHPHCALCCRPVDLFSVDRDIMGKSVVLVAVCHGKVEAESFSGGAAEEALRVGRLKDVFAEPTRERPQWWRAIVAERNRVHNERCARKRGTG